MTIKSYFSTNNFENDLLFLLSFCNDLWFIVLGELPRQYKDFQVAKEDYKNHDGL
jgi:hypothetical protein